MGICRYLLASIATAVSLLDEALSLAKRSQMPCDALKAEILHWRSACRRRQRDFEAAREDIERAIELARAGLTGTRSQTPTSRRRSLPSGRAISVLSRTYAQQARALYQELEDDRNVGRMTLNLGGLQLLLGHTGEAIEQLKLAFALAVEAGSQPDAARPWGAWRPFTCGWRTTRRRRTMRAGHSISSRAGRTSSTRSVSPGSPWATRSWSRDSGMRRKKASGPADAVFEQYASVGHRAGAWVALGDLRRSSGGRPRGARHHRNAAEALREIRF